jgi:hypothetical protein
MVDGSLASDSLTVTGSAPQWDVQGAISLTVDHKSTTGTVSGRLFIRDDGTADTTGLAVTLDGKTLELKFRSKDVRASTANGVTTYTFTGPYAFLGASQFGLADRGDTSAVFRAGSSLSFELRGRTGS